MPKKISLGKEFSYVKFIIVNGKTIQNTDYKPSGGKITLVKLS